MRKAATAEYLADRGLKDATPETLNSALQAILRTMTPTVYEDATTGLTHAEQAVLRAGGLQRTAPPAEDPLATTVAKYAAIITRSLSVRAAGERLGTTAGRVRQMISDRSLYSFLLDNARHIPDFQFVPGGLLPNIVRANRELDPEAHPVAVYNWYHTANEDLLVDGDPDRLATPLDWLKAGYELDPLLRSAKHL